ncbi:hypothetical protein ACNQ2K_00225 [Mycoplasma sp. VS292A]|uniref:hypothetical protein n=1 Tax=Mycoplasma sp. VS292A TaxID=3401680 RepID=UPI003AAD61E0
MAQKEISFLSDLGINFQTFQESEFNTQKPFKIPKKLYSIMPSASSEEIFTKTLFSVYNSCNALINNVINLLAIKLEYDTAKFIEAAGKERIALLKSAIFNEVNYRFTTQTTPELFNRLTIAPNNAQILGTPRDFYLAEQYLNPIAKKFLEDCEWDRLGVELGEAYNKAFEISDKLETFKNETAKTVKFELDYCQTQAERIRERCATLLDDKSYDITGKAISRIEASRDNYIGMLETNYKRLKNNADTEAEFRINKIKDVQKEAKDDVSKIVETAKVDIDSKFNTAKKELENKFLPVPDSKDKAQKLAREYGFAFMDNLANFSSALDEYDGKIARIEYELRNSKPNLEPLKQEIEEIKADVRDSERNVELELRKLDEATSFIQYVGTQADKNSNAIKKIDPIIKLLEQNKELATKDDLKNLPAGGGVDLTNINNKLADLESKIPPKKDYLYEVQYGFIPVEIRDPREGVDVPFRAFCEEEIILNATFVIEMMGIKIKFPLAIGNCSEGFDIADTSTYLGFMGYDVSVLGLTYKIECVPEQHILQFRVMELNGKALTGEHKEEFSELTKNILDPNEPDKPSFKLELQTISIRAS